MIRIVIFFLIYMVWLGKGTSQNFTFIQGKVVDRNTGDALPGATIIDDKNKGTTTGPEGWYHLELVPGKTTLTFRYLGYLPFSVDTLIQEGQTLELHVGLEVRITEMDQVVVSAGRVSQKIAESTVSMSIIQPQSLSGGHISDVTEMLNKTPGIEVLDGQASVRGGSGFSYGAGSRVLSLLDGLPMLSADAGNIRWQFLPLENISQIEIIKGASSVLYGSSALNGVINFRTAQATQEGETSYYLQSGIFDRPRNKQWVWWNTPRSFYSASFSHLQKYGYTEVNLGSFFLLNNGYRRLNDEKLGRMNMKLTQHHRRVDGLTYGLAFNGGYTQKTDFVLWENAQSGALKQHQETANPLHGSFFTFDPFIRFQSHERFRHELNTRIQTSKNDFPDAQNNNSDAFSFYSEYQSWLNIHDYWSINMGLMQNSSRITSPFYGNHTALNAAAYLQADITPIEKFTLVVGTRLEHNTLNGEQDDLVPLFRSGFNYRIINLTFLRGSYGQGYRFPSIAEKHAATTLGAVRIFPSPFLQPESGWNAELGIKQGVLMQHWNGMVDLALFYSRNTNLIEYAFGNYPDPNTGDFGFGFRAENTEYSRVYGLEVEFIMNNTLGKFHNTVQGGYVYMYPTEFNPQTQKNISNYLNYRRKHSGNLQLNTQYGIWDFGLSIYVRSAMLDIDDVFVNEMTRESILPGFYDYWTRHNKGYWLMDATLACQVHESYKVSIVVKNISNTEYMGRPGDMQPHRHFSIRITGKF